MIFLEHDNIIKFYGYFSDYEKIEKFNEIYKDKPDKQIKNQNYIEIFCLVLEFAPNGSLNDLYKKIKETNSGYFIPIEQEFVIKFMKQSLSALYYLGGKSILHRDIQPDNILLDKNYNIKITDFGISALFYDENPENSGKDTKLFSHNTIIGRQDFVAPEVEKGEQYDLRCDTFGLGLTMLCLMSEIYPITLNSLKISIAEKAIRSINIEKIDKKYEISLKKLVLKMADSNKENRPNSNQALKELQDIEMMIEIICHKIQMFK